MTIVTPAVTTIILLAMTLPTGSTLVTVTVVVLLGLFGLSANSVLIHLAVGFAGRAATRGSGLSVASFNAGTAVGTTIAGATLTTSLGLTGPAMVSTIIVALTLIPTTALALVRSRRAVADPVPTHIHKSKENIPCAALMYKAGDVRIENVPDSVIKHPTDALVRITASCICGSDLHPFHQMAATDGPARMGYEFIGVVEEVGSEVATLKKGDLVVSP